MLEKLKNLFQRKKKDKTVESRSKKKGHKFLLLFFFLALVLGIVLGLLTRKVIWIFFLPVASFALFFLLPEKEGENERTEKEFFQDFFLFASMTREGDESLKMAIDRLPISPLKERLVSALERRELTRSDFEDCIAQDQILADKVTRLAFKEEILEEDLEDYRSLLAKRKDRDMPSYLPVLLLIPLLLLTYLAIL